MPLSPDSSSNEDARLQERLANALIRLFGDGGDTLYGSQGYVGADGKIKYRDGENWKARRVVQHISGEKYIAVRPLQGNTTSHVAIDLDSTDIELVHGVRDVLERAGVPYLVNFSGSKGYHFTVIFSRRVEVAVHDAIRRHLQSVIQASPVGKMLVEREAQGNHVECRVRTANELTSLPCGEHPATKATTDLISQETGALLDLDEQIAILENPQRYNVERFAETKEIAESRLPRLYWRECVNILYENGVVQYNTRRSVTLAIASAILNNRSIPASDYDAVMREWILRTYPNWKTSKSLQQALDDGRDALKNVNARFKPTCQVSPYKAGLQSVCEASVHGRCIMHSVERQHEEAKWCQALEQTPIWGKLGHGKLTVYRAVTRLTDDEKKYKGMPVVCLPGTVIAENAGVSPATVSRALGKLVELGLIVRIPEEEGFQRAAYAIPAVDDRVVTRLIETVKPNRTYNDQDSDTLGEHTEIAA